MKSSSANEGGLTFTDLTTFVRGLRDMSDGADMMIRGMQSCDSISNKAGRDMQHEILIGLMKRIRDEASKAASDGASEIKNMIAELN